MALTRRLNQLCQEVGYALTHACSARDASRLILHTYRFHARNRQRRSMDRLPDDFEIRLRLIDRPVSLKLRTFAGDLFVLYEIFLNRPYRIPASVLKTNDVRLIIDCGANIGMTSLFLANQYPEARVIAVEPHPENFALLKFNTAHEPRIVPVHACIVGDASGLRYITVDRPAWGNTVNGNGNGIAVTAKTIDGLLREHGCDRVDLLKVDIEGAEKELFARPDFLDRTGFVIIELHDDYGIGELRRDLHSFPFEVHDADGDVKLVSARRTPSGVDRDS